jgi:hypothetical protein|tara:strand:+ start:495 stop:1085 length:591 start_codon:yes stop_codon:yes gene_type:complete
MANELTKFLQKNSPEMVIGVAVGALIAILMGSDLQQGITIIIVSLLVALVLNQLLRVFVKNEKNERTALIVLSVAGAFYIFQQFQLGLFSVANFGVVPQATTAFAFPLKAIQGISGAGLFSILGAVFFVLMRIPVIGVWLAPIFLVVMIFFLGIPIIGLSIAVFQNFQLILIIGGMVALAFMLLKSNKRGRLLSAK